MLLGLAQRNQHENARQNLQLPQCVPALVRPHLSRIHGDPRSNAPHMASMLEKTLLLMVPVGADAQPTQARSRRAQPVAAPSARSGCRYRCHRGRKGRGTGTIHPVRPPPSRRSMRRSISGSIGRFMLLSLTSSPLLAWSAHDSGSTGSPGCRDSPCGRGCWGS